MKLKPIVPASSEIFFVRQPPLYSCSTDESLVDEDFLVKKSEKQCFLQNGDIFATCGSVPQQIVAFDGGRARENGACRLTRTTRAYTRKNRVGQRNKRQPLIFGYDGEGAGVSLFASSTFVEEESAKGN